MNLPVILTVEELYGTHATQRLEKMRVAASSPDNGFGRRMTQRPIGCPPQGTVQQCAEKHDACEIGGKNKHDQERNTRHRAIEDGLDKFARDGLQDGFLRAET